MVTAIKEMDGARSVEVELKDGVVFIETGRSCFSFDARIFLRAIERELGVVMLRNSLAMANVPCGGNPAGCQH